MTMVGPYGDGTAYGLLSSVNSHHKAAAHLRRNMAQSVFNTLFVGWAQGLRFQQASTLDNINAPVTADSSLFFQNNVITDQAGIQTTFVNDGTVFTQSWYNSYAAANSIDTIATAAQINFVNAFTALGNVPDYRLNAASTASTGAAFTNPKFVGGFSGVKDLTLFVSSFVLYPNPTAANTSISFNLVEKNKVTVLVYDMLGNLVSNESQQNDFEKGNHTINLNTSYLSSGIYYVSLEINGAKETKKLVINK
jgi:hypothetical protein